eukprot:7401441-Alexandrium_andersonii.AAC.1
MVDKAVRQILIYGWGSETQPQRKACVERWVRDHNVWGACAYRHPQEAQRHCSDGFHSCEL